MICPHCNKEVDGYIGIKADVGLNLNLNNGCVGDITSTWVTFANVNAASPLPVGNQVLTLNPTGCANQQLSHYHTF